MKYKTLHRQYILLLFIFIDQIIKIIIKFNFMGLDQMLVWEFLRFKPAVNEQLSWINSSLNLGIGFVPHVLVNIIGVAGIYYFYKFYMTRYKETVFSFIAYTAFLAGAVCSLIDKIFWGGSLDYIKYTGFLGGYTFDLKDVYITSFEVMLVLGLGVKMMKDKSYLKSLNSIKLKDIIGFVTDDIRKLFKRIKMAVCNTNI